MSETKFTCDHGSLRLRENHWDTRAFGKPVLEITGWDIQENHETAFFEAFQDHLNLSSAALCLARVGLDQQRVLKYLQHICAFMFTEVTLQLSVQNVRRELTLSPKLLGKSHIRELEEQDIPHVQRIAATVFHHGRFAEDPLIPKKVHQIRQRNWIADMTHGPEAILVNEANDEVISFMAYKNVSDTHIDLLLGGSAENQGLAGVLFWQDLMDRFAKSGVTRIDTTVSAANLSVMRLYESLGFKVAQSWAGLHWHRGSEANSSD